MLEKIAGRYFGNIFLVVQARYKLHFWCLVVQWLLGYTVLV